MNAIVVAMLAACGVIASALFTYLAVVRRLSGKVGTTDAAKLWDEARGIREDYSRRLKIANERSAEDRERISACETLTYQLRSQVYALEETNAKLRMAVLGPEV